LLDLLINNGIIVDGTGNPRFYGSVGVSEDTVSIFRGALNDVEATRVIDAKRKWSAPGSLMCTPTPV
jgi:N-acyl-D-aspartate/D-glutamate deacylase